ncbi:hypothetical protein JL722_801 [Aureococcus anophagefferens]|nr:hypothetical protein JL722_801 [Aureococcus anophagefferens]
MWFLNYVGGESSAPSAEESPDEVELDQAAAPAARRAAPKKKKKKKPAEGKRAPKKAQLSPQQRQLRESARCMACGRVVSPATLEGFEDHDYCEKSPDGRRDDVVLAAGDGGGAAFRFLSPAEAAEASKLTAARLARELADARRRVASLQKTEKTRAAEAVRMTRTLEDQTLCAVCLDATKNAAFVPCGHRACRACADRCRAGDAGCPVCRAPVVDVIRVFN